MTGNDIQQQQRLALIEQSHQRCVALGLSRIERPDFEPLLRSDLRVALERNQRLSTRAAPVMEMLLEQIINTGSMIVLTDAQGNVLHTVGDDDFLERAGKVALAPGANWAEQSKGTNAIGTALFAELPTLVHASEHFMHANSFLTCSAAPIFDPRGDMLGVLDVTGDQRSYHQHTMGLVRMSARMIENHWLGDDYTDSLRLHFHARSEFVGTLLEGIVVVGGDGRIVGANRSAIDQIGLSMAQIRQHGLTSLFGVSTAAVFDHLRSPLALPLQLNLPDGRLVHVSARCKRPETRVGVIDAAITASAGDNTTLSVRAVDPLPTPASNRQIAPPQALGLQYLRTGDAQVEAIIGKLQRVINRDIPILILGETGSGKELLARAIHQDSDRAKQAFVAIDCSTIAAPMLEAELFGSAASDLHGARIKGLQGRIAQAEGGTLFIDEIGDLPAAVQARLLRVLKERRAAPLGSHQAHPVDIALICATQRRPRDMLDDGAFREDLYYRLNGLAVRLPALRERSDLPALTQRLLQAAGAASAQPSSSLIDLLSRHPWPGNIRQLANVLRCAALLAGDEDQITEAHLPDDFLDDLEQPLNSRHSAASGNTLEQAESALISQVLRQTGGNISEASRRLGISRNKIYRISGRGKAAGAAGAKDQETQ